MPLRDHDARFVVALDLLFVDAARQHIALIRRQDEGQLALLGEKLHWGEPATAGLLRAFREELGIDSTTWPPHGAGLRACRLGGLFGLDRPARDPRFLGAAALAQRSQVLSLLFLIEADLAQLVRVAQPGPDSSVLGLEVLPVAELDQQPLFLDHASLIRQVLSAEREGRLPLLPVGAAWPLRSAEQRPDPDPPSGGHSNSRKETAMRSVEGPSDPIRPPQRRRSTYIVDAEHAGELARLMQQDRLLTEALGGLLPEEGISLPETARVLDLACGPGGWLLELAFCFPHATLIGVDLSPSVVEYATTQARSRGLSNVSFQVMDVMEPLAFPDNSFDLINGRLLWSFMLPAAWPRLLAECRRLLRPGGIVRLTEMEEPLTTSPAFERLMALGCQALWQAGQSCSPDGHHIGITPVLPRLVRQAGFVDVRLRPTVIEWSADSPRHYPVFKNFLVGLELVLPFLERLGLATRAELTTLYQQAIAELQADDFCALWPLVTVWGYQPS